VEAPNRREQTKKKSCKETFFLGEGMSVAEVDVYGGFGCFVGY
jgi:hypothetical protein